jgi:hypothetical protein
VCLGGGHWCAYAWFPIASYGRLCAQTAFDVNSSGNYCLEGELFHPTAFYLIRVGASKWKLIAAAGDWRCDPICSVPARNAVLKRREADAGENNRAHHPGCKSKCS